MDHRPNILQLATKISLESLTYTGITYNDPEYRILEPLVDDDMCQIMMHMRLEADRTVEEIARRAKKSVEFTREQCLKLRETGIVRTRTVDGQRCYYYPIWVPGIMEGILSNREQCEKHPELEDCFEEYTRRRVAVLAPSLPPTPWRPGAGRRSPSTASCTRARPRSWAGTRRITGLSSAGSSGCRRSCCAPCPGSRPGRTGSRRTRSAPRVTAATRSSTWWPRRAAAPTAAALKRRCSPGGISPSGRSTPTSPDRRPA